MKEKLTIVIVILALLGMSLGISLGWWWIKRTFNWKFFYGKRFIKIEQKIDNLDHRLTILENKFKNYERNR